MKLYYILIIGILWNAHSSVGDSTGNDTLRKLKQYSSRATELTNEMNTLVESTKEKYFVLTHSNYEWCGVTINRFQSYLQRIQNSTKDEAMKQHRIEIQVLRDGLKKITTAKDGLEKTYLYFLNIARKNIALTTRLNAEFNKYNDHDVYEILRYLTLKAEKSRQCVWKICWDTKLTQQIKSVIQSIEKKRDEIRVKLDQAFENADIHMNKMKTTFWADILAIRDVIPQVEITLETIKNVIEDDLHDSVVINEIKIAVEKLIEECRKYRARHEP